jgi:hypothetical protein
MAEYRQAPWTKEEPSPDVRWGVIDDAAIALDYGQAYYPAVNYYDSQQEAEQAAADSPSLHLVAEVSILKKFPSVINPSDSKTES